MELCAEGDICDPKSILTEQEERTVKALQGTALATGLVTATLGATAILLNVKYHLDDVMTLRRGLDELRNRPGLLDPLRPYSIEPFDAGDPPDDVIAPFVLDSGS